jgi:AraC family transcriptional regulator
MDHPWETVTDIAMDCGFSSPSVFARSFKERFGASASRWRAEENRKNRTAEGNHDQADSNAGEAGLRLPPYTRDNQSESRRRDMSGLTYAVEVRDLPELHVAYVRHTGAYSGIGAAFQKLMRWAGPRGLLRFPETRMLGIYHNDPGITEAAKLRSDACITVPEGTAVDGEIGLLRVPGGKFAVARFEISADQFGRAWDALMGEWLPGSGYQPDDRMCYELYLNDPEQHPQKKFILEICQPVRPL